MQKMLKFFGTAVLLLAVSILFAACSDSGNDTPIPEITGEYIMLDLTTKRYLLQPNITKTTTHKMQSGDTLTLEGLGSEDWYAVTIEEIRDNSVAIRYEGEKIGHRLAKEGSCFAFERVEFFESAEAEIIFGEEYEMRINTLSIGTTWTLVFRKE